MHSLTSAAAHFATIAGEMAIVEHHALEKACVIVETEAKRVIGTYEYDWTPLAASTLARKKADTPLLETGEMRESIEHTVQGSDGYVGSNDMKAVYQELGTATIPARSFLEGAARHKEHEVLEETGRAMIAALSGKALLAP